MKKQTAKKLVLNRETLRELTENHLSKVVSRSLKRGTKHLFRQYFSQGGAAASLPEQRIERLAF